MPKLRPVSYKQLVKVFEAVGFSCVRIEGDHMVMTKRGVIRPVVIPKYAPFRFSSSRIICEPRGCRGSGISNFLVNDPGGNECAQQAAN